MKKTSKIIANERINMYFCPQNRILTLTSLDNGE